MQVFRNSIWSFNQDKPIPAEHEGSVVLLDSEPLADEIVDLLESHDRVVTPTAVHDIGGAYDRQSGDAL
jgi:dTDP-4-amino-4,6-dideoxygalactose transaminase